MGRYRIWCNRQVETIIFNIDKGFNLIELCIVVAIVAILASFAIPQFAVTKERALDKEAKAVISLMQAAEKIYKMEVGKYYPYTPGPKSDASEINEFLRLSLPISNPSWSYTVDSSGQQVTGTRLPSGRSWTLTFSSSGDPICSGSGCP